MRRKNDENHFFQNVDKRREAMIITQEESGLRRLDNAN